MAQSTAALLIEQMESVVGLRQKKISIDAELFSANTVCVWRWSDFVSTLGCQKLHQLGGELIEAYRRLERPDGFCFAAERESNSEIDRLQCLITDHRASCPLCREMARAAELEARKRMNPIDEIDK